MSCADGSLTTRVREPLIYFAEARPLSIRAPRGVRRSRHTFNAFDSDNQTISSICWGARALVDVAQDSPRCHR
ncbi:hypothetical protein FA95DRAFT_130079 [Auriscalpium vulgare]|uniref:Uncharacterized protein n=1 Tax=Auriscalpium vulgare TaxID=40419 RepID=A0ACB8RPB7_9AGAM|nr:hypothetical protein FA95DRAFT_130079 [Auriscalpium vulgare]